MTTSVSMPAAWKLRMAASMSGTPPTGTSAFGIV